MLPETGYTILSWVYIFITLCLVINRLYVRASRRSSAALTNWSDSLVVLAWIFNLAQVVLDTLMYAWDAFTDPDSMDPNVPHDPEKIRLFQKLYYAENVIYYIPLYLIKLAILCFLLEITPQAFSKIRKAIMLGFALTAVGTALALCVYTFAQQQPVAHWLERSSHVAGIAHAVSLGWHMFTDLYIYAIPFFLVRNLTLISRSQRVGTWVMFGAGFILVGLAFMQLNMFPTLMWSFWWSLHEQSLALVIACLPSFRVTILTLYSLCSEKGDKAGSRRKSFIRRVQRGVLATNEVADVRSESLKEKEVVVSNVTSYTCRDTV